MIDLFNKMIRRAVPGFPDFHITRHAEVTAIADAPADESATDRFRPRWAVDCQLLTAQGEKDQSAPILEALPLPATPVMRYPEIGELVRVAFDYGSPAHPYIVGWINEGRAMPALAPGETLLPLGNGAFLKADAKGNLTLQTDGGLTLDAGTITVAADDLVETLGSVERSVEGDVTQEIGGSLLNTVLGALVEKVAGDVRRATLGSDESAVTGDKSELVAGNLEIIGGLDINIKSALGDVLLEAIAGSAELKSAVKSSVVSALVDLGLSATEALVLGDTFLLLFNAHTHSSSGAGQPNVPMIPGVDTSVTVKTT